MKIEVERDDTGDPVHGRGPIVMVLDDHFFRLTIAEASELSRKIRKAMIEHEAPGLETKAGG